MKKIVVGGQIDKKAVAKLVEQHAEGRFEIEVKSDLEAAMAMKSGQADYYFGACNTGGGGALAMAIALIGRNQTSTVSMPGNIMSEEKIQEEIAAGKKAFGFTAQHMDQVVPIIMKELVKKEQ